MCDVLKTIIFTEPFQDLHGPYTCVIIAWCRSGCHLHTFDFSSVLQYGGRYMLN